MEPGQINSSPSPDNQPIVVGSGGLPSPPSSGHDKGLLLRWVLLIAVSLLLLAAIGTIVFILVSHRTKKPVSTLPQAHQLCFVRLNYLNCVNKVGTNRIRYRLANLPQNSRTTSLVSAADQSGFLATSPNGDGTNSIWTISANMQVGQQVQLPSGQFGATPSWSLDNQSVLLEVDGANNSRQIERYLLSSNSLELLTATGYNTQPYQTKSGQIIYNHSSDGQTNWLPYMMSSDGSKSQPLGDVSSLSSILGFSYDPVTDTIFVFGNSTSGQPAIIYGTSADFINNRTVKTIVVPAIGASDQVSYVSTNSIVVSNGSLGTILSLTDQSQIAVVQHFGNLVGSINTAALQKAKQQTEQQFERIINLSTAPQDFVPYIENQFKANDQSCQANAAAQADGIDFEMTINQVVSDSFASVSQACTSSSTVYYAKDSSGDWAEAFADQGTPTCSQVNQFKFTSQIIPQCYNDIKNGNQTATNQLITNPNQ